MPPQPGDAAPSAVSSTLGDATSAAESLAGNAAGTTPENLVGKTRDATGLTVHVKDDLADEPPGLGGAPSKAGYPQAPPPLREDGFHLDNHQRAALWFGIGLLAVAALLSHLLLSLLSLPPTETVRQSAFRGAIGDIPPWILPWLKVAIVAALGMILNRIFVVAYHGFSQKDFDAESIVYHASFVVKAPFIVVATFGLGSLFLAADFINLAPAEAASPLLLGLAFFFGYWSDDVLEAVHRWFLGKLGRPVEPRKGVVLRLDGTDMPLPALLQPKVAEALNLDVPTLSGLVAAFRKHGFSYTHEIVARCDERHKAIIQAEAKVPMTTVESFIDLCDVLRGAGSVPDAALAFGQRIRTGPDAAAWLKHKAGTADGQAAAGALAGLLSK